MDVQLNVNIQVKNSQCTVISYQLFECGYSTFHSSKFSLPLPTILDEEFQSPPADTLLPVTEPGGAAVAAEAAATGTAAASDFPPLPWNVCGNVCAQAFGQWCVGITSGRMACCLSQVTEGGKGGLDFSPTTGVFGESMADSCGRAKQCGRTGSGLSAELGRDVQWLSRVQP